MKAINRKLARVPVWLASLLVALSLVLWSTYAAAQLQRADEKVEVAKATATAACTEAAHVKAELSKKERALAEANARLRAVGEPPVSTDKSTPPLVAPVMALASYVADWSTHHGR